MLADRAVRHSLSSDIKNDDMWSSLGADTHSDGCQPRLIGSRNCRLDRMKRRPAPAGPASSVQYVSLARQRDKPRPSQDMRMDRAADAEGDRLERRLYPLRKRHFDHSLIIDGLAARSPSAPDAWQCLCRIGNLTVVAKLSQRIWTIELLEAVQQCATPTPGFRRRGRSSVA